VTEPPRARWTDFQAFLAAGAGDGGRVGGTWAWLARKASTRKSERLTPRAADGDKGCRDPLAWLWTANYSCKLTVHASSR